MTAGPIPSDTAREVSDTEIVDAWGCIWIRRDGANYSDILVPSLQEATVEVWIPIRGPILRIPRGSRGWPPAAKRFRMRDTPLFS